MSPHCAGVHYFRHRDTEGFAPDFREAIVHEIFPLFGYSHHGENRAGIEMSRDLTEDRNWRPTAAGIEALGCAYPHPDFPR